LHVKQRDGKNFVIISAEDRRAIEETLFLNKISGMVAIFMMRLMNRWA
jgi:PHD/YefM family antitoxin component YafN of YafNO toxin-antitoxin module